MVPKDLGFVGLGNMGLPMATNIVSRGFDLMVFDKVAALVESFDKGQVAVSISQLAGRCETIFFSLPNGDISKLVATEIAKQSGSKVKCIIDLSTTGVDASRDIFMALKKAGIVYIDAPVSGGKSGAVAATIALMWGGPADLMESYRPVLEAMAGKVFHVGDEAGQAQSMKLLNNYLSATAMTATSEAISFGLKQGLDMKTMLDVLNVSSGQNTATSDKFPKQVLTGNFAAGFHTALMTKDLNLFHQQVKAKGTPARLAVPLVDIWREADEAMPGSDFSQIYEFINNGQADD